jgi:hypothetical protein
MTRGPNLTEQQRPVVDATAEARVLPPAGASA